MWQFGNQWGSHSLGIHDNRLHHLLVNRSHLFLAKTVHEGKYQIMSSTQLIQKLSCTWFDWVQVHEMAYTHTKYFILVLFLGFIHNWALFHITKCQETCIKRKITWIFTIKWTRILVKGKTNTQTKIYMNKLQPECQCNTAVNSCGAESQMITKSRSYLSSQPSPDPSLNK